MPNRNIQVTPDVQVSLKKGVVRQFIIGQFSILKIGFLLAHLIISGGSNYFDAKLRFDLLASLRSAIFRKF